MITGHSDPLLCFYTHYLARISIESMAKPGGAMLPLAPPPLPHSKTRGCTAPPCSPPLASLPKSNRLLGLLLIADLGKAAPNPIVY